MKAFIVFSFLTAFTVLALTATGVNGQATYRIVNGYDVVSNVATLNSFTVFDPITCVGQCSADSNCKLAVFKSTGNVCNLYASPAINKVNQTASSGVFIYQKPLNG
jgi:hypothetical protein